MVSRVVSVVLAVVMATFAVDARPRVGELDRVDTPMAATRPLAEAVGEDGSLKVAPGFSGSFDARGWRLAPGPNGAPRFERTTGEDDTWRDVFSSPGTDDIIRAVAVHGDEVYVGGAFATIGKASVNNVARWDGERWSALGEGAENGVDGTVYGITATPTAVYVGGTFRHAGTVAAANVAKWDGTRWSALGTPEANGVGGFGQLVYAIGVDGQRVYVGGSFTEAGGVPAASLAVYDEATRAWAEFGGVANEDPEDPAYVFTIAVTRKDVFVGGKFTRAGETAANYIARYSKKSGQWAALDSGTDGWVTALAVKGKKVYAGGFFRQAGGLDTNCVAQWDGRRWSALDTGLSTEGYDPGYGVRVKGLTLLKGRLYVSGYFSHAGGEPVASVAEYRAGAWRHLDGGLKGGIRVAQLGDTFGLAAGSDGIYVAGVFNTAGDARAFQVAKWSPAGAAWSPVADAGEHQGVYEGLLWTVAYDRGAVYVGGDQMIVGGVVAYGVAKWESGAWSTLGEGAENGVNGAVNAIAFTEAGDVIVGGLFGRAGTTDAINVARWDGTRWHDIGIGVGGSPNSQVFALAVDGSDLYVAGIFPVAGDIYADNIARWDGTRWSTLGSGIPAGPVLALAARGGTVYAGGIFPEAGGVSASNVARWDGANWSPLGLGIDGAVFALALEENGRLYAGGDFTTAGGANAADIAVWENGAWAELGGGVTPDAEGFGHVLSLSIDFRGRLQVGGYFTAVGDVPANNVATWFGSGWTALGSGTNGPVNGVVESGGSIFLSGGFSRAGGRPSVRFAEWAAFGG
jgi:hypothetical protein